VGRNGQHRLGQDQAIGHYHHQIRLQVAQLLLGGRVLQRLRLVDRNATGHGFQLDRRRRQATATAGRTIRLGVDGHDLMMARSRAQR